LVVEAKDDPAATFYRHHGFIALPDSPMTLFLPLAVVRFLSSPAMQNFDVGGTTNARALEAAVEQTKQGFAMLEKMNPQAVKGIRIYPGLG
jgi:hypothetical protein